MVFQHQFFSRILLLVTALLPGVCMTKNKRSENIGIKTLDGFRRGKICSPDRREFELFNKRFEFHNCIYSIKCFYITVVPG